MRSLGPDEKELWARVTASIRPLSRDPPSDPVAVEPIAEPIAPQPRRQPAPKPAPVPPARQATGGGLDGTWDKKLRSGSARPDRIVDLHGMNLDRAWRAIDDALERSIAAEERLVLLITGHERRGEPPIERGRIRAAVRDWLSASRHSGRIAAVRGAHPRHGGGGSLYIILRRR